MYDFSNGFTIGGSIGGYDFSVGQNPWLTGAYPPYAGLPPAYGGYGYPSGYGYSGMAPATNQWLILLLVVGAIYLIVRR